MYLRFSNLFTCLAAMFERTNDFKGEPRIINRNFTAHGMNTKRITKMDCIQLFLVLHNLSEFLDIYDLIEEEKK